MAVCCDFSLLPVISLKNLLRHEHTQEAFLGPAPGRTKTDIAPPFPFHIFSKNSRETDEQGNKKVKESEDKVGQKQSRDLRVINFTETV